MEPEDPRGLSAASYASDARVSIRVSQRARRIALRIDAAERKVELGTAVGRDNLETELFVIVDLSRVWIDLSVSSADLPMVKEGQSVTISTRGVPKNSTARIVFVGPLLDKDTRSASGGALARGSPNR